MRPFFSRRDAAVATGLSMHDIENLIRHPDARRFLPTVPAKGKGCPARYTLIDIVALGACYSLQSLAVPMRLAAAQLIQQEGLTDALRESFVIVERGGGVRLGVEPGGIHDVPLGEIIQKIERNLCAGTEVGGRAAQAA